MKSSSGGRIFLRVLGFLILAGGIASIALGLVYIIPDIRAFNIPVELYYLMGGAAGLLISIIFLILGFRKTYSESEENFASNEYISKKSSNDWNLETKAEANRASNLALQEAKASFKIKETKKGQPIICQKCGAENVPGSYYCSGCKSALKKICKLCGHDNPHGTEICEGCGKIMQITN